MKLREGLAGFLLAYGITAGIHTGGHIQKGYDLNVDVGYKFPAMYETWDTKGDKRKESELNLAGFEAQDRLTGAVEGTSLENDLRKAEIVYKMLYMVNPSLIHDGDIYYAGKSSGNKHINELVATTIIFDYLKLKKPEFFKNQELSLIALGGTPGIMYTVRW